MLKGAVVIGGLAWVARRALAPRVGYAAAPPATRPTDDRGNLYDPAAVDDVTMVVDGLRCFRDGALVGLFRTLKGQRWRPVDARPRLPNGVSVEIAPPADGGLVRAEESAAVWLAGQTARGYVVGAVGLAFDTAARRFLHAGPPGAALAALCGGDQTEMAVLVAPGLFPVLAALDARGPGTR